MKKILFTCLCSPSLVINAAVDFSQDRPLVTDIPPALNQLYVEPENPTRKCGCNHRKNRWARCNKRSLQIKNK